MKAALEKLLSLSGLHRGSLLIISLGMICGMVFNNIFGNSCFNPQGILGGVITSALIIWLNPEE